MRREKRDLTVLNEPLIEEFTDLNTVIKFANTVILRTLVVFKDNNVLYFLVPDWEVDCRGSTSYAILRATSDSCFKLLEKWYNTRVLNFSTSDFAVDATDSTSVDADSRPLRNVSTNSHVRAKDLSLIHI